MSKVTTTPAAAAAEVETPEANRFTLDAQERMARIRAMAADFEAPPEARPLTPSEIGLARKTPVAALEKAAVFADAAGLANTIGDMKELRDAIAYELAYAGVRDEARALARRIDVAIARKKHKASSITRALYSYGKGVENLDIGDPLKTHIGDMKRTLIRTRRRKIVTPEEATKTKQ